MSRTVRWLCAALLAGSAAAFVFGVIWPAAANGDWLIAFDVYAYFYPNARYALDRVAAGGGGLLWNPYQDCGQPFFAISQIGLLYPVNWLLAVLPREPGLMAMMVTNLTIAGVGAWWLGRTMGLTAPAALAGALAFQLGGSALTLASWSPIHIAPYAWLPAAMAATERLIARPGGRRAVVLGVVLALQLLPGFPQISVFTYQAIALRVAWELVTARVPQRGRLLAYLVAALALPPLLIGVQFVPALEVARESIRTLPLRPREIGSGITVAGFRTSLGQRGDLPGAVLTAVVAALVGPGLLARTTRRLAAFYLLLALLYFLLALGDSTPVFGWYRALPGGGTFRGPDRFLWVTSFALAAAAGLGVEAATRPAATRRWPALAARLVALATGLAAFAWLSPIGLTGRETALLVLAGAAVLAAGASVRLAGVAALALATALAINGRLAFLPLLNHRHGDIYSTHAAAIADVRARLTPMDRVLFVPWQQGYDIDIALTHKMAMLEGLPSVFDYEPQASLRYAQYFTYMRLGRPLASVYDWYQPYPTLLVPSLRRPLFDLTAARFILIDRRLEDTLEPFGDRVVLRARHGDVAVYENRDALPRAFFVPNVRRVPEASILPAIGDGRVDPRRVALLAAAEPLPEGGLGGDGRARGTVRLAVDTPEHVVFEVEADAPGFLHLSDQYARGWQATVNGRPAPILRANHVFRVVAVPGSYSRVEFRYRPATLRLGALVSLAGAVLAGWLWIRDRGASS